MEANHPSASVLPDDVPPTATVAHPQPRLAISSVPAHLRFWIIASSGLAIDLISKYWAFRELEFPGGKPRVVVPYLLELQAVLNPGALFGIGKGMTSVFLIASLLALGLVIWMFAQSAANRWVFHLALGAILAGAIGNMYDRVNNVLVRDTSMTAMGVRYWHIEESDQAGTYLLSSFPQTQKPAVTRTILEAQLGQYSKPAGHVRDFIKIPTTFYGRELWPWVFNVADMLLVGGVSILAIGIWRERAPEPGPADANSVDSPAEAT